MKLKEASVSKWLQAIIRAVAGYIASVLDIGENIEDIEELKGES